MSNDQIAELNRLVEHKKNIRDAHLEYMIAVSIRKVAYSKLLHEWETSSEEMLVEAGLGKAQYELIETFEPKDFKRHKAMFQAHNHLWATREFLAVRNSHAGAIFVDLDSLIKRLTRIIEAECKSADIGIVPVSHKTAGREIKNGVKLGAVIWAAGNNFRHHEEWPLDAKDALKGQVSSMKVLQDLLGKNELNYNLCGEVLTQISDGRSTEQLFKDFDQIGRDLIDSPLELLRIETDRLLVEIRNRGLMAGIHMDALVANSV